MKKKAKKPKIIMEKTFEDEETGRVTIREYDLTRKGRAPKKKQIVFPDPLEEGCISIDWSKDAQKALSLAGVKFDIIDFGVKKNGHK